MGVLDHGQVQLRRVDPERASTGLEAPVADSFSVGAVDAELRRELYRSRRYERPLVIAAVRLSALNGYRATARDELESRLRALDRVWEVEDHVVVLLPETDRAGAEHLLARLRGEVPGLLPVPHVGVAAFPTDALTAADLLSAATSEDGASANGSNGHGSNGHGSNGNGAHGEDGTPADYRMVGRLMRRARGDGAKATS